MAGRALKWEVTFAHSFLTDGTICPAQKALVLALAGWCDLHGRADCTKAQLEEATGIGQRQMYEHLKALRLRGYLKWKTLRMMGKNRNLYELLSPCGIRMVKRGGVSVQFPHGSFKEELSSPSEVLPEPTGLLKTPPHPPPTSCG